MVNYEVTIIVDPVLSGDEIKATATTYEDLIKDSEASITQVDEFGLKQLAYPIKKRTSGVYYSLEFSAQTGTLLPKMELALKRDERILRFLTVKLDKHGVKYNQDKRDGKIGKKREKVKEEIKSEKESASPAKKAAPVTKSSEEE